MLGILYLILDFYIGYNLLDKVLPGLFNVSKTKSLFGKSIKLDNWMVTLPASFLTGTLIMTWITYLAAYILRGTAKPLLFGNIFSFSLFLIAAVAIAVVKRCRYADFFRRLKGINWKTLLDFYLNHKLELWFIVIVLAVWSFYMFRSFNVKDGVMNVGFSVFSDFGPHLAVIRSFSEGSNFPTEYPHFANGHILYHFMFQFLVGNLEFLGLRIDWAFNLPSILSLLSFLMLLYSFTIMAMGEKWTGIIASTLFFFRSSFAFFTYIYGMDSVGQVVSKILGNDLHIGKTTHEEWGLWAQKVYVNQRHLAFALGVLMLILIIMYPLFKKMILALKKSKPDKEQLNAASAEDINESTETVEIKKRSYGAVYFKRWIIEFLFKKDAWLPADLKRSIAVGLLLGLIGFWNGAVVIATLPILFIIALFSKHRLEFLNTAVIAVGAFYAQTVIFIGFGQSSIKPQLTIGFLTNIPADLTSQLNLYKNVNDNLSIIKLIPKILPSISQYYVELLGILPFVLLICLFVIARKMRWLSVAVLVPAVVAGMLLLMPDIGVVYKYIIAIILLFIVFVSVFLLNYPVTPRGSRVLLFAFFTPIIVANTLQLTPDIAINHKYIMISVILLNIIIANLLYRMFKSKKVLAVVAGIAIMLLMTITGFVDAITLYNLDKDNPDKGVYKHVAFKTDDPVMMWVKNNTQPNDIFLTSTYCIHPILLAGRKIFYGWPYFTWGAGYDTATREIIVKQIYGGSDAAQVKSLVKENGISYIVIEDDNRNSEDYKLNEKLIKDTFKPVYENEESRIEIYSTK